MTPILLIGGGGHCRSCIDVIEAEGKYKIAGIVNQPGGNTDPFLGYEVLGDDGDLPELFKKYKIVEHWAWSHSMTMDGSNTSS